MVLAIKGALWALGILALDLTLRAELEPGG